MNVDIMYNFLTYNITLFTIQLEFNVIHILITSIIYKCTQQLFVVQNNIHHCDLQNGCGDRRQE